MITLQQVQEAAKKSVEAHPDRLNPMDSDGGCLNTDPYDGSRHCIAAQVFVDLGKEAWLLGTMNNSTVYMVVSMAEVQDEIEVEAVDYLAELQGHFDGYSQRDEPWGVAWENFDWESES